MDVFSQLTEHVLPIDFAAATIYPEVVGHPYRLGTSKSRYDAQITAFCRVDGENLATSGLSRI